MGLFDMVNDVMAEGNHGVSSSILDESIPASKPVCLAKDGGTDTCPVIQAKEKEKVCLGTTASMAFGTLPRQLFPVALELPPRPPPANECNYTHYYVLDLGKEHHDQYLFRHANGLCVIGLAPSHVAFKADVAVTAVDFNVGKTSRTDMRAVGKRKKNAHVLESNSVLCKVMAGESSFLVRCSVRGTLLEVNQRLIKDPQLLLSHADTEGHIAIMMPRPEDWAKVEKSFLSRNQYREQRGLPP